MRIIGVDFSGAGTDTHVGKTWIARGELTGNVLTIENCCPISRAALTRELESIKPPAVVAMDFPFSVPEDFANFWQQQDDILAANWEMPDLWAAAAGIDLEQFRNLRDEFVPQRGEPRRAGDPPESFSCLHDTNPDMVPMTFRGMQMLHRLWQRPEIRVPPLHPDPEQDSITLLEVMPGATLRSLDLPYKGYKNGQKADELRQKILNELPGRAGPIELDLRAPVDRCHQGCYAAPRGENPLPLYAICRHHDDALDAVVAAIAAALWAMPETREHFISPPNPADPTVRREGWLYTPGGCYLHNCVGPI